MIHTRPALGLCAASLAALAACGGPESETGAEPAARTEADASAAPDTAARGAAAEDTAGAGAAAAECAPDGEMAYLCGLTNAEDIVAVGDTGWLVASSLGGLGGAVGPGRIYLIDAQARNARELFPGASPD